MRLQLLNAFYDSVNYSLGTTISYTLLLLMTIGVLYVMAKYLGGEKK
ncbi:MAG: hypothetical protein R2800_07445 [Flavipsychrobacter sp.]